MLSTPCILPCAQYGQIYKDSIHEKEANRVGKYINEQVLQMIQQNQIASHKQNDYSN